MTKEEPLKFVVQEHQARSHHYDFRLEVEGVLKSWAVPKGPSANPRNKRLAMQVDDHPLDYADFEGVIPEGEYGAGTVLVWDNGTYHNITQKKGEEVSPSQGLEDGHIAIKMEGKKLKGGYALVRIGKGASKNWLLMKMKDDEADLGEEITVTRPESVVSGKTIEEIAKAPS